MKKLLSICTVFCALILIGSASAQMGGFSPFSSPGNPTTTTVGNPGVDTQVPTEKAVRTAITDAALGGAEGDPIFVAAKDNNATQMLRTDTGSATSWPTVSAMIAYVRGKLSTCLLVANNLSDGNVTAMWRNLGLGNAAGKNTGTGSGDVAAGNHTHTGYLSTADGNKTRELREIGAQPVGSYQTELGFTPENVTNKDNNGTRSAGDTTHYFTTSAAIAKMQSLIAAISGFVTGATSNKGLVVSGTTIGMQNCSDNQTQEYVSGSWVVDLMV